MSDIDIRCETYAEALKSYLGDASKSVSFCTEPEDAIREYGLTPQENVNPKDYPAGTWFYYTGGNTYVR